MCSELCQHIAECKPTADYFIHDTKEDVVKVRKQTAVGAAPSLLGSLHCENLEP